jgi:vitamin K-dependent gamma-carboxylase
MSRALAALRARALAPVDIASLAVFRILFGLMMCGATLRVLARGWVRTLYVEPRFHFTWPAFWFVAPWPGVGMYVHFVVLALAALGMAAGYRYRICAVVFLLAFSFVELIDQAVYLNHYYLITLLAFLLAILPADRAYSLDARRRSELQSKQVPAWVLGALRLQIGVVYFYAGVAKLNHDWLLRAQPLRLWLSARSDWPLMGPLFAQPAVAFAASWLAALFDLGIVGMLLVPKTRRIAFALVLSFHLLTGILFPIGVFPWVMTLGATLFFSPDWPRRFGLGAPTANEARTAAPGRLGALVVAGHCALQLVLPWRQLCEPGPSAWTSRGFNFAWKVMVAEKGGAVHFEVVESDTGRAMLVEPLSYLTPLQDEAMAQDPDMIRALGRHIGADFRRRHGRPFAVHAHAFASLNGRAPRRMVDPGIDLASPPDQPWILPLD